MQNHNGMPVNRSRETVLWHNDLGLVGEGALRVDAFTHDGEYLGTMLRIKGTSSQEAKYQVQLLQETSCMLNIICSFKDGQKKILEHAEARGFFKEPVIYRLRGYRYYAITGLELNVPLPLCRLEIPVRNRFGILGDRRWHTFMHESACKEAIDQVNLSFIEFWWMTIADNIKRLITYIATFFLGGGAGYSIKDILKILF